MAELAELQGKHADAARFAAGMVEEKDPQRLQQMAEQLQMRLDELAEERNRLRITTAELEARNAQLEADLRMAREVLLQGPAKVVLQNGYCFMGKSNTLIFREAL